MNIGFFRIEIKKFDDEEFGSSMYARTVSSIDYWFGKILKKINLEKTLLVITADHGERIPFEDKGYSHFQPKFEPTTKLGKKLDLFPDPDPEPPPPQY